MKLEGVYTALVTPFKEDGSIDPEGMTQNIRYQIEKGVDGIVVLGTTGEAPTLTHQEQEKIMYLTIAEAKGKIPVVVGTGSYSTLHAIENTKLAKDMGADAALVITPYYNKPTQEGIFQHFNAIANSVDLPLIVYNHPGRTGINIETETLKRIADHPNIIGVKDASGSIAQFSEVIMQIGHTHDNFSLVSADDAVTLPLMALGGKGVISVMSNLIPTEVCDMVHSALKGDFKQAQKIHHDLLPLCSQIFSETNPIPIKEAMRMCGMPSGICRLPLTELSEGNKEKLQEALRQQNLLTAAK